MIRYGIFLIAFVCCGFSALRLSLTWSYPRSRETPDLVFNVYYTDNPAVPLREWKVLRPVPGFERGTYLKLPTAARFYTVTASNYLGESDPAKR